MGASQWPKSLGRMLRQPECLIVVAVLAGFCSIGLLLVLSMPSPSLDKDAWRDALVLPGGATPSQSRSALRSSRKNAAPQAEDMGRQANPATSVHLQSLEAKLDALDARLAAAARLQPPPATPASANEALISAQVLALNQQVSAVLSLLASDRQRAAIVQPPLAPAAPQPPPALLPPAPPVQPPPQYPNSPYGPSYGPPDESSTGASDNNKVNKPWTADINVLRKELVRLSDQSNDRYSQLVLSPTTGSLTKRINKTEQSSPPADGTETDHVCRSPPCSRDVRICKANGNCCSDLMFEMLADFSDFLTKRNITHFVVAGTLIGAVREKDIIPYTSDIDLLVPRAGWAAAKEINLEDKDHSYHFLEDPEEPHCARLCAVWKGLPVNRGAFGSHFDWDTERVGADVRYYMDIYDEEMEFSKRLEHLHFPLSKVTIRNKSFPAPREQEMWVEARYGAGWKTPDNQAREEVDKYPTLEKAQTWSQNSLLLRRARRDAGLAHKLLEGANVDHKSGKITMSNDVIGQPPSTKADRLKIEGDPIVASHTVKNSTVIIWPAQEASHTATYYTLFWAKETVDEFGEMQVETFGKGIINISVCGNEANPFACELQQGTLEKKLPFNLSVPDIATHLATAAANDAGRSSTLAYLEITSPTLNGSTSFSRYTIIGLLRGFTTEAKSIETCTSGARAALGREGLDSIVNQMVKRTFADMKAGLLSLVEWLRPVEAALKNCRKDGAGTVSLLYTAALTRVKKGKLQYEPGKKLDIDDTSIFYDINGAIGQLREGKFFGFGKNLGAMLARFASDPGAADSTTKPLSNFTSNFTLREAAGKKGVHDKPDEDDGAEDDPDPWGSG